MPIEKLVMLKMSILNTEIDWRKPGGSVMLDEGGSRRSADRVGGWIRNLRNLHISRI